MAASSGNREEKITACLRAALAPLLQSHVHNRGCNGVHMGLGGKPFLLVFDPLLQAHVGFQRQRICGVAMVGEVGQEALDGGAALFRSHVRSSKEGLPRGQ